MMDAVLSLLKWWPWGLGALLVLAGVGAALNPVAALKLARELGGFVLEKGRAAIAWLRKPGRNWWRIGCMLLGFAFMLASFAAWDQRREVLVVTERCQAQLIEVRAEADTANAVATDNRRAVETCRTRLVEEVGRAADVARLAQEAVAKARADAKAARQSMTEWERNYSRRPPTCEAALRALEDACPTITDY